MDNLPPMIENQNPIPVSTPELIPPTPDLNTPEITPKNKSNLLFVIILLLIIIAVFGYLAFYLFNSGFLNQPTIKTQKTVKPKPTAVITPVTSPTEQPVSTSSGNSNIQLDQDSKIIDNNLNSIDTELKNIDQGLNDTAINLSE
jgi:hypothetical protein